MPAQCFVRFHKPSMVSVIIASMSNSPTTRDTGLDVYTTTTAADFRKMALRNSNRFSPRKMASAYFGLIDNNTWIAWESESIVERWSCVICSKPRGADSMLRTMPLSISSFSVGLLGSE